MVDTSTVPGTVCIVSEEPPTITETFIQAHIDRLPARVIFLHGLKPRIGSRNALSMPRQLLYKVGREFLGHSLNRMLTAAYSEAFRRCRAIAVLAEYGPSGAMVLDACRRAEVPLVVHFHGYDASVKAVLNEYAEVYRLLFAQAAAIIAVSRVMKGKLISLGAPAEKVHYNPYGIDCVKFSGGDPAVAPPLFVAVGRLVEKKGPLLTIRAFGLVHRSHPDARLRIVGDGPLLGECLHLVQRLGLGEAVTLLGPQSHEAVHREMRGARCFVQHSIEAASGDCEGTPLAILEAGAMGLPVVSTLHGGIPDVVIQDVTGLLVREGDVEGMARAMTGLLEHPPLAARLGAAARERVVRHFSVERSLARLSKIIESCVRIAPVRD